MAAERTTRGDPCGARYDRAPMSKRTSKKKQKARTSKANHGTKPNAGRG
jgi:hypothetical protein